MASTIKRNILVIGISLLMGILFFAVGNVQNAYADDGVVDSGVYDGVPWKITSDYDLIIGETGMEYTFDYKEERYSTDYPWDTYRAQLKTASFRGKVNGNGSCRGMFMDCTSLNSLDVSNLYTSNVTDMGEMFRNCSTLTSLEVGNFDTSKVTLMGGMFMDCKSLDSLDVSNFNTSNVTNIESMFYFCTSLENLDVSFFDTQNVQNMNFMFCGCHVLTSLDVSNFDTSGTTHMCSMFAYCYKLSTLKVGKGFNADAEDSFYSARFPIEMYDYEDGMKYSVDEIIPAFDTERVYVSDASIIPSFDPLSSGNVNFNYEKSYTKSHDGTTTVYYDNNFFTASNSEYNHQLATASLGLAMAGMHKEHVKGFLETCGFGDKVFSKRFELSRNDDSDEVAYTFATKKIKGHTVIAVVLRGGDYGNEWGSNGRVGHLQNTYGYHYGFNKAADYVIENLNAYCEEKGISLHDAKVWVTGYSRAAAVSNCVGMKLEKDGLIEKDNLYCYTFATPRTVTEENTYKSAQGIYNIVNPLDLVPCVPLNSSTSVGISTVVLSYGHVKPWNYTRHGNTLELPSALGTWKYRSKLNDMRERFVILTDGDREYVRALGIFNGGLLQVILDILSASTASEKNYVENLQDQTIVPLLELSMGKGITDDAAILAVISGLPGAKQMLQAKGFIERINSSPLKESGQSLKQDGVADNPISMQHWPEAYLAWMNTGIEPKKACAIKSILVQCPVDVEVYDSDNELVARITDDQVDESIEGHLESYVDEAGAKTIAMPAGGEYRVVLTATDNGTMSYSVKEIDEDRQLQRKVVFENIEIQDNQVFSGSVDEVVNTDAENYALETNGETVLPDSDLKGEDLSSIEIKADISGPGVVVGEGLYTLGDSVVLEAFGIYDNKLIGWYDENGELISSDSVLTTTAAEAKTFKAKFSKAILKTNATVTNIVAKTYTGKALTQKPVVKVDDKVLKAGTDYTVTYKNNKKVGKATVTITGKGNFTGSIKKTFKINPKGTTISKLVPKKKAFVAKWKKRTTQTTGYQILIATNAKFTKGKKTVTITKNGTTFRKITNLKAKKKYFVKIRTYKTVNGVKYWSAWSKYKTVKTK